MKKIIIVALYCTLVLPLQSMTVVGTPIPNNPPIRVVELSDGMKMIVPQGVMEIHFLSDSIVKVGISKKMTFFGQKSIAEVTHPHIYWKTIFRANEKNVTVSSPKLSVVADRATGNLVFLDAHGNTLLAEAGRELETAVVQGEHTWHVRQQWAPSEAEALYGLGQHQDGVMDKSGYDIDLWQRNTTVIVPYLVSSNGYGIFWDNTSFTRFGDLREFEAIPAAQLLDKDGQAGGLTLRAVGKDVTKTAQLDVNYPKIKGQPRVRHESRTWEGFVEAPSSGDYQLECYSNGGILVNFDGKTVMEHWRQGWLTETDRMKLSLVSGKRYSIRISWDTEQGSTLRFRWKTPNPNRNKSLWSEVGDGVDYTFVYGPELDKVLAGYRFVTGAAPLMPNWAFGLWQSRQRYETAQDSLDVVDKFRDLKIPFDNIVQDWMYWRKDAWGSHEFDKDRFPDPNAWIKALHAKNAHVMISVWGKFYSGTENFKAMQSKGYLYQPNLDEGFRDWMGQPYTFYDAFNPGARKLFWDQIRLGLFDKGIDAWWMDATEPDLLSSPPTLEGMRKYMNPTALGSGSRMLNGYPLMNSRGIYEGQRQAAPDQRVFILTRSGFAGSQHYSAATWSGDVTSTWTALKKQIVAGLGMSLSGIPYWTTDIGGYTMSSKFFSKAPVKENEDEWRELNTRWFQFGTFCPLLRVHGENRPREMWQYGGESSPAYKAMLKFDRLRYRLFPYIYSTAWAVTRHDETFMRPLVMDYPSDKQARVITDEYLFGHAFLVSPVTEYKARKRGVLLPGKLPWYDFWTGKLNQPGVEEAEAAFDSMPLFVRAGSIVPMGPELQYVAEKPQDPITLYVYAGADASFTLYEDDGLSYGYEKGQYAEIPLQWNDAAKSLLIGARKGSYPGMLKSRTFQIVLIDQAHPKGFAFEAKPQKSAAYDGAELTLNLN